MRFVLTILGTDLLLYLTFELTIFIRHGFITNLQIESDIYMFAITMWEMLERDVPFKSIPMDKIGSHVWKVSDIH